MSIRKAVPALAIAFGLYVVLGVTYRVAFYLPNIGDGVCAKWFEDQDGTGASQPSAPAPWGKDIQIDTRIPCLNTGLTLQADQRYSIGVTIQEDWKDATHDAGINGLSGITHLFDPAFVAGVPSRRRLLLPWFTLTGEIGRDSGYVFPLQRKSFTMKPRRTGTLYVYVNDAINGLGAKFGFGSEAWDEYYSNNAGTAIIKVEQLP